MKLIRSIHTSFVEQTSVLDEFLLDINYPGYIKHLDWYYSKENFLFWNILHLSYSKYAVYDYLTLVKIFAHFGSGVFDCRICDFLDVLYENNFDKEKGTLESNALESLISYINVYRSL